MHNVYYEIAQARIAELHREADTDRQWALAHSSARPRPSRPGRRTGRLLAVVALMTAGVFALVAVQAWAQPIDLRSPDARDAGAATAVDLRSPDARDAGAPTQPTAISSAEAAGGFNWTYVAVGMGAAVLLVGAGGVARRRRTTGERPVAIPS